MSNKDSCDNCGAQAGEKNLTYYLGRGDVCPECLEYLEDQFSSGGKTNTRKGGGEDET